MPSCVIYIKIKFKKIKIVNFFSPMNLGGIPPVLSLIQRMTGGLVVECLYKCVNFIENREVRGILYGTRK